MRPFKGKIFEWLAKTIFVAFAILACNEMKYFYACQGVARSFSNALGGLEIYEVKGTSKESTSMMGSLVNLQSFKINPRVDMGQPRLEIETDAITSSALKMEQNGSLLTHYSFQARGQKNYKNHFFASVPSTKVDEEGLVKVTSKELEWKLGLALIQESLIFRFLGFSAEILFFILFGVLNMWFAGFIKSSARKFISLRFFGLTHKTIIPIFLLKNGISLMGFFFLVGSIFGLIDIYLPWSIYLITYSWTLALSFFLSWTTFVKYQHSFI